MAQPIFFANYQKFYQEHLQQNLPSQPESNKRLWQAMLEIKDFSPKNLLVLFGRINEQRISKNFTANKISNTFDKDAEDEMTQFLLLMKDHFIETKKTLNAEQIEFQPSIHSQDFSWNKGKFYQNAIHIQEHVTAFCRTIFNEQPMPCEFARALKLSELPKLKDILEIQKESLRMINHTLFRRRPLSQSSYNKELKSRILLENNLLKYAAVVDGNSLSNWMKELFKWQSSVVSPQNLSFLKAKQLIYRNKNFKVPFSADTYEESSNQSFRDYLIAKTIDEMESRGKCEVKIPEVVKKELHRIFKNPIKRKRITKEEKAELIKKNIEMGEFHRQTTCFFLYVLRQLFAPKKPRKQKNDQEKIKKPNTYCPIKAIKLSFKDGSKKSKDSLLITSLKILNRLYPNCEDDTSNYIKKILTLLAYIYAYDYNYSSILSERNVLFQIALKFDIKVFADFLHAITATFPPSCRADMLEALSKSSDFELNERYNCFRSLIEIIGHNALPSESRKREIKPINVTKRLMEEKFGALMKDPDFQLLVENLNYYISFLYFVGPDLTDLGKILLYDRLKTCTPEEKEAFNEEINAYGEANFSNRSFQKRSQVEMRRELLQRVYTRFNMMDAQKSQLERIQARGRKGDFTSALGNLLDDWPENFKQFNYNEELIKKLEEILRIRLPIRTFVNILLYPIVLKPMLDLIDQVQELQNKIAQYNSQLFIPSSLLINKREILMNILSDDNLIYSTTLTNIGGHFSRLIGHFMKLQNFISSTLQLEYTYPLAIVHSCDILSPRTRISDQSKKLQNLAFNLTEMSAQKTFCLVNWTLPKTNSSSTSSESIPQNQYPIIELTFMRSTEDYISDTLMIPLKISMNDLKRKPAIVDLLKGALDLCQEFDNPKFDNKMHNLHEPSHWLAWILSDWEPLFQNEMPTNGATLAKKNPDVLILNKQFRAAYEICKKTIPQDELTKYVNEILDFVKSIKVFSRIKLNNFCRKSSPDGGDLMLTSIVTHSINDTAEEKSLCQMIQKDLDDEFEDLVLHLTQSDEAKTTPFCTVKKGEMKFKVTVKVEPDGLIGEEDKRGDSGFGQGGRLMSKRQPLKPGEIRFDEPVMSIPTIDDSSSEREEVYSEEECNDYLFSEDGTVIEPQPKTPIVEETPVAQPEQEFVEMPLSVLDTSAPTTEIEDTSSQKSLFKGSEDGVIIMNEIPPDVTPRLRGPDKELPPTTSSTPFIPNTVRNDEGFKFPKIEKTHRVTFMLDSTPPCSFSFVLPEYSEEEKANRKEAEAAARIEKELIEAEAKEDEVSLYTSTMALDSAIMDFSKLRGFQTKEELKYFLQWGILSLLHQFQQMYPEEKVSYSVSKIEPDSDPDDHYYPVKEETDERPTTIFSNYLPQ